MKIISMNDSKFNDYILEVLAHTSYLQTEDDSLIKDLKKDDDDIPLEMRKAAMIGTLAQDKNFQQMLGVYKAFYIEKIDPKIVARIIAFISLNQERNKRNGLF